MIEYLEAIGTGSLGPFWAPVLIWTGLAGVVTLSLKWARDLHPLMGYRLRQAVLLALPASILVALWLPPVWGTAGSVPASESPSRVPAKTMVSPPTSAAPGASEPAFAPPAAVTPESGAPTAADVDIVAAVLGMAVIVVLLRMMVRLWMLATDLRRLRSLRRAAVPVDAPVANRVLGTLKARFGIRKRIALLEGPPGSVPMTFGSRRPVIMVPGALVNSPCHLRTVLAHEFIHIRRADFLWALLDSLTTAAFGLHPLVWLLGRQIERCRETSCDAEVVAAGIVLPRQYAELLAGVHAPARFPMSAVAASLAGRSGTLKQRLETIAKFAKRRPASRLCGGAALAFGLPFFSLGVACGSDVVDDGSQVSSWRFEKVWELNALATEFMAADALHPTEVAAGADGRVYLLNEQAMKVFVLSEEGELIDSLGRRGSGPGEFANPDAIDVTAEGVLNVLDLTGRVIRWSVPGGRLLEHVRGDGYFRVSTRFRALQDGFLATEQTWRGMKEGTAEVWESYLTRWGPDGIDRLVEGPTTRHGVFETPDCIRGMIFPALFSEPIRWDYREGMWAVAADTAYVIEVSGNGEPVARIELDIEPREVTKEMARREVGEDLVWGRYRECIVPVDEVVRGMGHAKVLKPIADLRISPAGEIWVLRGRVKDEPAIIDIFAKTGEHLGTLPPDSPFPIEFVGADRILVAGKDEFGATLTMMRVSRR